MDKVDFRKVHKRLYAPPADRFDLVDVPAMQFLMVDGQGDPNVSADYARAVEWLYGVSYKAKFAAKKTLGRDHAVPPLEGLWYAEDMSTFLTRAKAQWSWTMMIMQPDWIGAAEIEDAVARVEADRGARPATLRLERFDEGRCAQILHVGPYDAEGPTIARLHAEFLPGNGLIENGHHHEIYLSDPRKTAPERLKTILRQPVRPAG